MIRNVKLVVLLMGLSLTVIGYALGIPMGTAILGMITLSPVIFLLWIPLAGMVFVVGLWPFVGYLTANANIRVHRIAFVAVLLSHYLGAIYIVRTDLKSSDAPRELYRLWQHYPWTAICFGAVYVLVHALTWSLFLKQKSGADRLQYSLKHLCLGVFAILLFLALLSI